MQFLLRALARAEPVPQNSTARRVQIRVRPGQAVPPDGSKGVIEMQTIENIPCRVLKHSRVPLDDASFRGGQSKRCHRTKDGPSLQRRKPQSVLLVRITALSSKIDPIRDLNDSKQVHDRRRRPSNHVFQPLSACNNALPSSNLVHCYQKGSDHHKHASSFLWNL